MVIAYSKLEKLMEGTEVKTDSDLNRIGLGKESLTQIDRVNFSDCKLGRVKFQNWFMEKIARYFHIMPDYLIFDDVEKPTYSIPVYPIHQTTDRKPIADGQRTTADSEIGGRHIYAIEANKAYGQIEEGDIVYIDQSLTVHNGDLVHYKIKDGEAGIMSFNQFSDGAVRLYSPSSSEMNVYEPDQVEFVFVCVAQKKIFTRK